MDINQAVADYVTAHEIENFSADTIANTRRNLRYFVDWLQSEHNITDTDELQLTHLRGWINHLQKTPTQYGGKRNDSSIRTYGMSMLAFCHWLEQEEVIEKPITTRFRLPRSEKKFIPTFAREDIEQLLSACEHGDKRKPQLTQPFPSP